MKAADIETLLKKLGCSRVKPDSAGKWVASTCPLAPWTHAGGVDAHPSFGVSIHPEGESKFRCFTCSKSGNLTYMLWFIGSRSGKDLSSLGAWTGQRNLVSLDNALKLASQVKVGWKGGPKTVVGTDGVVLPVSALAAERSAKEPPPLPEDELKMFEALPPSVRQYLREDRRLTEESIEKWGLKWHDGARRIAIPIRNLKGELVGVSGRAYGSQKPKFLHSSGFRRDFYLYGEQFCTKGTTGYLTEGFFDVMYLHQKGINAFAIMGSYLSAMQVDKCITMFNKIVIVPDGDKAGAESSARILDQLGRRMPVVVATVEEGKDPDQLTDDELDVVRKL